MPDAGIVHEPSIANCRPKGFLSWLPPQGGSLLIKDLHSPKSPRIFEQNPIKKQISLVLRRFPNKPYIQTVENPDCCKHALAILSLEPYTYTLEP